MVHYEPKKSNLWVLKIMGDDGLNEQLVSSFERPKFKKTKWWNFWKKYEISLMKIRLRDTVTNSTIKEVYKTLTEGSNFDIQLSLLDPTGVVLEIWEINKCEIVEVDFGKLDYRDDGLIEYELSIKPNSAKLVL
mgnify:FL=1